MITNQQHFAKDCQPIVLYNSLGAEVNEFRLIIMKTQAARIILVAGILLCLVMGEARAGVVFDSLYALEANSYGTLSQSTNGRYFWGTTLGSGSIFSPGTVFQISTNGYKVPAGFRDYVSNLVSFTTAEGGGPRAGVTLTPSGLLCGTASAYARSNSLFPGGMGAVFSVYTNALFSQIYSFGLGTNSKGQPLDGACPRGPVVVGPSNALYGTTYYGGTNGYGGTNAYGAKLGFGTIFEIPTNLTGGKATFIKLHSFTGVDGVNPTALVLGRDTNFYGVATFGGSNLTVVDTNGDVGFGTIFKVSTAGALTTLYCFGSATNSQGGALDGSQPNSIMQASDGNFYGTTTYGGLNATTVDSNHDVGYGTIFKITTNGALTTLYSFGTILNSNGTPLDGAFPSGPLAEGPDGNFYGVTTYGGATNTGTIFAITPAGILTTLHSFAQTNPAYIGQPIYPSHLGGSYPRGGVIVGTDANLYGTTSVGGPLAESDGSFFSLGPAVPAIVNAPGTITVLAGATNTYSIGVNTLYAASFQWLFNGSPLTDGGEITGSGTTNLTLAGLTLGDSGTYTLVASNVVGSSSASGALTVVPALITEQPSSAMIVAGSANTFSVGVTNIYPVAYQWQFGGTNLVDGGEISGSSTSNLTVSGATLADAGAYLVIISNAIGVITSAPAILRVEPFSVTNVPTNLTIMAGSTATLSVGVQNAGAIHYQWAFDGANLSDSGNIFGSLTATLTITNAVINNAGTYSVTISNASGVETLSAIVWVIPHAAAGYSMTNVHSFNSNSDGALPNALTLGSDGALYGTTTYGGSNGLLSGTIFKFVPGGSLATLYSFTGGADEADPNSALVEGTNGVFFGTTWSELYGQYGTVFEFSTNGTVTTLATFNDTNGADPNGVTYGTDGSLYGTTYMGGDDNAGTVFSVNPTTSVLDLLVTGTAVTTGNFPLTPLTLGADGNFYGGTETTVFELNSYGALSNVFEFLGSNSGLDAFGALLQTADGQFYGTTAEGGIYGGGTVFRFSPNTGITNIYSFGAVTNSDGDALDGLRPLAGLSSAPDGSLYGTTYSGGFSNCGTVFKITTNGALTTVAWFSGGDGAGPAAPLTLGVDGNFYSTTQYGGVNNNGAIFELTLFRPVPAIQSVSAFGGMISMTWSVISGQTYQVQYAADLSQAAWANLGPSTVATGSQLNVSDSLTQSQRFYRLEKISAP